MEGRDFGRGRRAGTLVPAVRATLHGYLAPSPLTASGSGITAPGASARLLACSLARPASRDARNPACVRSDCVIAGTGHFASRRSWPVHSSLPPAGFHDACRVPTVGPGSVMPLPDAGNGWENIPRPGRSARAAVTVSAKEFTASAARRLQRIVGQRLASPRSVTAGLARTGG